MSTAPDTIEKIPPPRRRWYRLHLSTWLVMLLTAGFMSILVLPGENPVESSDRSGDPTKFHHGWPWVFLKRDWMPTNPASFVLLGTDETRKAPWLKSSSWKFYENFERKGFSVKYLLLDLTLALFLVLAVGMIFEWRRRKRTRLIQFTLRELLLLMLLTAGVFSLWKTNRDQRLLEQAVVEEHDLSRYLGECEYSGPDFLIRLVGLEHLDDFYRHKYFLLFEPKTETLEKLLPLVKNFRSLKNITIHRAIRVDDVHLAELAEMKSLEELCLFDSKLTDAGMETISGFRNLTKLNVAKSKVTDKSIPLFGRLPRLKVLDISGTQITRAGDAELKKLLPKCILFHDAHP